MQYSDLCRTIYTAGVGLRSVNPSAGPARLPALFKIGCKRLIPGAKPAVVAALLLLLPGANAGADKIPGEVRVRVVAYNVEKGNRGSPEEIAVLFMNFKPDLIGFSEVPGGNWTERVGTVLGDEVRLPGQYFLRTPQGQI